MTSLRLLNHPYAIPDAVSTFSRRSMLYTTDDCKMFFCSRPKLGAVQKPKTQFASRPTLNTWRTFVRHSDRDTLFLYFFRSLLLMNVCAYTLHDWMCVCPAISIRASRIIHHRVKRGLQFATVATRKRQGRATWWCLYAETYSEDFDGRKRVVRARST